MFSSTGIIRTEPKSKSTPLRPWWALIECCPDLSRYYLEMSKRAYWFHKGIQRPAWDGHITIIRGEEPPAGLKVWKEIRSIEITFYYEGTIQTDGKHFWLPVICQQAEVIRLLLGLPAQSEYPFHLTFGVAEG